MERIIDKIIEDRLLAAIYTNTEDSEKFTVGKIIHRDDLYIFCKCFDEYGEPDGYEIKRIDQIYLLELNGEYLESLEIIDDENDLLFNPQKTCMEIICSLVLSYNYCISVELAKSGNFDVRGTVVSFEKDIITCQTYNEDGQADALAYFQVRDVSCITIHSQDDIELEERINLWKR